MAIEYPETEYRFFFTVAGILWWDIHYRSGNMERYFAAWKNAVERLDRYDNVTFYSGVFNSAGAVCDLSHYCDYCHADAQINALQAASVINGDRIITADTVDDEIDILRSSCSLWSGQVQSMRCKSFLGWVGQAQSAFDKAVLLVQSTVPGGFWPHVPC